MAPPSLKSLGFAPNSIDTPADVTLSLGVADDASGVTYFEVSFVDPSGASRQTASGRCAPTLAGTLTAKLTFPRTTAPGVWSIAKIFLSDGAGNTTILDTGDLNRMGFPTTLEIRSPRDSTPPQLRRLEFSPSRIDTSDGPVELKVDLEATDDVSGVNYAELVFVSPSGAAKRSATLRFEPDRSVAGSTKVSFPRRCESGPWMLQAVFLSDAAGNTRILNRDDLSAMGTRTELEVASSLDTEPPRLESLSFSPETIDTSAGAAAVNVTFRATDASSGVKSLEVVFEGPSPGIKQTASAIFPPLNGLSDSVRVVFPHFSEPGEWTLSAAMITDAAGNTVTLDRDALAERGVRTMLIVKSVRDTVAPQLLSIAFSPAGIETTRRAAAVEVDIKAKDNSAGLRSAEVVFVSPSGAVRRHGSASFRGTLEETLKIRIDFPAASEPGEWTLESIALADAVGNTVILDSEALASRVGRLRVQ